MNYNLIITFRILRNCTLHLVNSYIEKKRGNDDIFLKINNNKEI